ncbi:TadE/TadG family type IV pilus assembly protein [Cellulomonas chengniuliangii]|uniref:TadE/TadG family type IV pilus assembly protein n=1 Tax=Cellulomonas chengniuliangii TaxID=2968084 RepID=UPI001D0EF13B|nr:pilus assembly protein [Cellulomonas chengniuliangii]MCC2316854.1 pilus assembly protein [Cellulomonas chengniuliangii]
MRPPRVVRWWRARLATAGDDRGNAVVEFLGAALLLIIPVVYLVLVLGRLQAATFAVEGAARESGRAFARAEEPSAGTERAIAAVGLALADQGFGDASPSQALTLGCSSVPCLEPGSEVSAEVEIAVPLPFVPSFVRGVVPLEIPVSARHVAPVDRFRGAQ